MRFFTFILSILCHLSGSCLWQRWTEFCRGAHSGYKWPLEYSNGFSERILEESLASITPYFRQASMKRAVRSKCLMLPRRWEKEKKRHGGGGGESYCQKAASSLPGCLLSWSIHQPCPLDASLIPCESFLLHLRTWAVREQGQQINADHARYMVNPILIVWCVLERTGEEETERLKNPDSESEYFHVCISVNCKI